MFLFFKWISGSFVLILFLWQLSTSKKGITVGGWGIHIFGAMPQFLQCDYVKASDYVKAEDINGVELPLM